MMLSNSSITVLVSGEVVVSSRLAPLVRTWNSQSQVGVWGNIGGGGNMVGIRGGGNMRGYSTLTRTRRYPPVPWAGISQVFHEYFKYSRTVPAKYS